MDLMQDPHVENLDLRSLRFLARLLETGSVTRAGEACGLSQPTASRVLARLREALGDPLLVRGQQGHVLTSRAEALQEEVREAEAALGLVFAQGRFDPATTERVFHVAASEYTMCTGAGALLRAVLAQAPLATIHFEQIGTGTLDALEAGTIDLAFLGHVPPEPFRSLGLGNEHLVGVVDQSHPLAREAAAGQVTLDRFLDYPHIQFRPGSPGQGAVDLALAALGRSRRLVFTSTFLAALWALVGTDLVMSIPSQMADLARMQGLVPFKVPLVLPTFPYSLVWHRRSDGDPAVAWLRDVAADATRGKVGEAA
jgi:DNA-binding transcriptional LysR family regulator